MVKFFKKSLLWNLYSWGPGGGTIFKYTNKGLGNEKNIYRKYILEGMTRIKEKNI